MREQMPDFEIFKGNTQKLLKNFRHDNIILVYFILLAIVMGIVLASSIMFYINQQSSEVIQSGVFIKGINVSGLTKQEAVELVTNEITSQMHDHIELTYKNYNFYVEIEQIGAKFDIESSVDYAYNLAKTGNFFSDLKQYISILMTNIDIEPILVYNDEALTSYLEIIESNLPDQLQQYGYYIDEEDLIITSGVNGAGIEIDELKPMILDAIQDISYYPTLDNLAHIPGKTSGNQARRISGIPFINCKQIEIMFVLFFHDPSLRNLPNHISCFDIINFNCERKRTFAPCAAIHKMINIPTHKNFGTLAASKSQCPVYLKWSGIWRKFQCLESSLSQPDLPNLSGKQIAESNCVIAQLLHHAQWNKHSTRFVI